MSTELKDNTDNSSKKQSFFEVQTDLIRRYASSAFYPSLYSEYARKELMFQAKGSRVFTLEEYVYTFNFELDYQNNLQNKKIGKLIYRDSENIDFSNLFTESKTLDLTKIQESTQSLISKQEVAENISLKSVGPRVLLSDVIIKKPLKAIEKKSPSFKSDDENLVIDKESNPKISNEAEPKETDLTETLNYIYRIQTTNLNSCNLHYENTAVSFSDEYHIKLLFTDIPKIPGILDFIRYSLNTLEVKPLILHQKILGSKTHIDFMIKLLNSEIKRGLKKFTPSLFEYLMTISYSESDDDTEDSNESYSYASD